MTTDIYQLFKDCFNITPVKSALHLTPLGQCLREGSDNGIVVSLQQAGSVPRMSALPLAAPSTGELEKNDCGRILFRMSFIDQ